MEGRKLILKYEINGAGWATVTLTAAESSVRMTASYVHDSLGNLADAVLGLVDGKSETTAVFMDEPGEHHLHFRRERDQVAVTVTWYDDWASWNMSPKTAPKTVLSTTASLMDLRRLVTEALADVLKEHGMQGYKEKWSEHEFPVAQYERLREG